MFSPRVIDTAVKNFRDALQMMSRDRTTNHVFDFATDTTGHAWSLLVAIVPDGNTPAGTLPSAPMQEPPPC